MRYVQVSGKTYEVKETLKRLGLRWDGDEKVWKGVVNENALHKLTELANKYQIELTYEDDEDDYEEADRYTNRYTNSTWVRCWECGRPIAPGKATKDVNGKWYCGC